MPSFEEKGMAKAAARRAAREAKRLGKDAGKAAEGVSKLAGKGLFKLIIMNPYIGLALLCILAAFIIYTVYSVNSTLDKLLYQYTHLVDTSQQNSKAQFDKKLHYIKVNSDGTTSVVIGLKSEIDAQQLQQAVEDAGGGTTGTENITPATNDVVIDDWLVLHAKSSTSGDILTSHLDVGIFNENKWSMGEGENVKPSKYCVSYYEGSSITPTRPVINKVQQSVGYTTSDGRYYVAIGPGWFNPDATANPSKIGSITPSVCMNGVKQFDIVVNYEGSTYYIYAALGDAKAHTFSGGGNNGKGIIQTGFKADGSGGSAWCDFSCVEWVGVKGSVGAALSTKLEFVGLKK